ncbi:DJ-1/PfpI family protein [Alkalisalibacterium limincola]|uniref:DJ-1/PfpI family protein n=1 Tax=Alkalisalibacterium limincola TaxID=2699169 RepID=A0A5C8KLA5_9GAMM|nr:DJ-1/PfpI family protein [Alkalisalibacterium limincola]TXK61009.1 DJ-1/PfpI family protein [Alkalisalibacterium limincola]
MTKRSVALLIYPDVEVLDFAGPFEVFSVASQLHDHRHFDVSLVAAGHVPLTSINGMRVCANHTYDELPSPDVLVVPGGDGSHAALRDEVLMQWVDAAVSHAELVLSVCSGARVLAALGHLRDLQVTTHHEVFDSLAELEPTAHLCRDVRFVDTGHIVTSAGISAGIDASLHVVARLLGAAVALRTAEYMEYHWVPVRDYD